MDNGNVEVEKSSRFTIEHFIFQSVGSKVLSTKNNLLTSRKSTVHHPLQISSDHRFSANTGRALHNVSINANTIRRLSFSFVEWLHRRHLQYLP